MLTKGALAEQLANHSELKKSQAGEGKLRAEPCATRTVQSKAWAMLLDTQKWSCLPVARPGDKGAERPGHPGSRGDQGSTCPTGVPASLEAACPRAFAILALGARFAQLKQRSRCCDPVQLQQHVTELVFTFRRLPTWLGELRGLVALHHTSKGPAPGRI